MFICITYKKKKKEMRRRMHNNDFDMLLKNVY